MTSVGFRQRLEEVVSAATLSDSTIGDIRHIISTLESEPALAALIDDRDQAYEPRGIAGWLAGRLPCQGCQDALIHLVRDPAAPEHVRITAATSLALLDGPHLSRVLLELGLDPEQPSGVRMAALVGSVRTGGIPSSHKPRLIEVLADLLTNPSAPSEVRGAAAEALKYVPSARSLNALRAALADKDPEIRFWAIYSLGQLGSERDIQTLEGLLSDDSKSREGRTVGAEAGKAIQEIMKRVAWTGEEGQVVLV